MGIKFLCPNGHKLHVKSFLASQRGVCPQCGEKFIVPAQSLPELRVESIGVKRGFGGAAAAIADPTDDPEIELIESTSATARSEALATRAESPANRSEPSTRPIEASSSGTRRAAGVGSAKVSSSASSTTDPLSEVPQASWYVRIASGDQFGPAPADMMRQWLGEGRVTADSLVWREGWAEWAVAGRLFPQLSRPAGQAAEFDPAAISSFEEGLAAHVETLVLPAANAVETIVSEPLGRKSQPIKTSTLEARRKASQRGKLAMIALVVAVVCLLPVLAYVLLNQ